MKVKILVTALLMFALFGCKEKGMSPLSLYYQKINAVPQEEWEALAQKKIYFGHQSVGQNILDGLKAVMESYPQIRLNIVETLSPDDFALPLFAHSRIGRNRDPHGKIDHFKKILENGVGRVVDIALFKFCYVDVVHETNAEALIKHYDETLAHLIEGFPNLRIIPVSLPLTNTPKNPRARIKRLLGKGPATKMDNIKRNIVNAHLRQKYGNALWDLADIEATGTASKKASFNDGRQTYFLLNPAYTYDGGHLNDMGSQVVAIDLLLYLLSLDIEQLD